MLSKWQITHSHTFTPFKERISCDHLFCHINCQSHDKWTHTHIHDKSGRARFTGHIETQQAYTIHNKMIYHFCIKRFATLPFWLWTFCFALLKTVFSFHSFCFVCSFTVHIQLSSSVPPTPPAATPSSETRKIPNLYSKANTLPYTTY